MKKNFTEKRKWIALLLSVCTLFSVAAEASCITLGGGFSASNSSIVSESRFSSSSSSYEASVSTDFSSFSSSDSAITTDDERYRFIVELEKYNLDKKFIPYSIGSPTTGQSFDNAYERANILFFSDSHIDIESNASLTNLKDTIDYANGSKVEFDCIINGGDAITTSDSKSKVKALAEKFFGEAKKSTAPFLFTKGNHDCNDFGNIPDNTFTDADFDELWLDFAESNYGIVRRVKSSGDKSTYHYYDINDKKIRVIVCDAQDVNKTALNDNGKVKYSGANSWGISNEQLNWVAKEALNFDDKGEDWGVLLVIHQYPSYSTTNTPAPESSIQKLFDLCVAFNTQAAYSNHYAFPTDEFFNIEIDVDYTRYKNLTNKPHIISWLLGHEHVDKHEKRNGINLIWTANGSATSYSSDARVARVIGTATQNSFDVLNVDTRNRKIRLFRYGAGENCYGNGGDRFLPDGLSY